MSAGTQNITSTFRERQYSAYREQSQPPWWFRHKSAAYTGPTLIVFPGTLTIQEQIEVRSWLAASQSERPNVLAKCTQRAAVAKITEYIAYYADVTYLAWRDTEEAVKLAQWRLFLGDAIVLSKATVPASSDNTGAGSGAVTGPFAAAENTPD